MGNNIPIRENRCKHPVHHTELEYAGYDPDVGVIYECKIYEEYYTDHFVRDVAIRYGIM